MYSTVTIILSFSAQLSQQTSKQAGNLSIYGFLPYNHDGTAFINMAPQVWKTEQEAIFIMMTMQRARSRHLLYIRNKAVYTTAPAAYGWAGQYCRLNSFLVEISTMWRTDGPTDRVTFKVTCIATQTLWGYSKKEESIRLTPGLPDLTCTMSNRPLTTFPQIFIFPFF